MSLYSAIDVPCDEKKSASKSAGFIPLYGDPEALPCDATEPLSREAAPPRASEKPNAALQFAPSARKRPAPSMKRKVGSSAVSNPTGSAIAESEQSAHSHAQHTSVSNVPRLEVINSFDDYAQYQPEGDHSTVEAEESRRKSKRGKRKAMIADAIGWDDDYDPARPIEFEDYLRSTERQDAHKDWQEKRSESYSFDPPRPPPRSESRPLPRSASPRGSLNFGKPKSKLNFAPSLAANVHILAPSSSTITASSPPGAPISGHAHLPTTTSHHQIPPPPPPVETAEEAYARRAKLQHELSAKYNRAISPITTFLPASAAVVPPPPPPPPPIDSPAGMHLQNLALQNSPRPDGRSGAGATPNFPVSSKIMYVAEPTYIASRAVSEPPNDQEQQAGEHLSASAEVENSRGSAPGQKGFARRYMASQGWSKGQGLGASRSGRLAPLFVKPLKDGKTGKIIDRHKAARQSGSSKMTRVVLLEGMINLGEPIDEYVQQDVGDSCSSAYGKVERVKLVSETGRVLVKFTDPISALRCISMVEGREFDGKHISARYYPEDAFERGEWNQ